MLVAPVIPGLNDEEIPRILEAAAERGAQFAGFVLLRLPGPVAELFTDWIEEHFPECTNRILGRLRSMRDGALTDTEFGRRMRGRGEWASILDQLFHNARRQHDFARGGPPPLHRRLSPSPRRPTLPLLRTSPRYTVERLDVFILPFR